MNASVPGGVPCTPKRHFLEVLEELRRDMGLLFQERTLLALVCRWVEDPSTPMERTVVAELMTLAERTEWLLWEHKAAIGEAVTFIEARCG